MVRAAIIGLALMAMQHSPAYSAPSDYIVLSSVETSFLTAQCPKRTDLAFDPCVSYILGVFDGLSSSRSICPKGNSVTLTAVGVVRKYLADHPEEWNLPPAELVTRPLRRLYPCK